MIVRVVGFMSVKNNCKDEILYFKSTNLAEASVPP